MRIGILINPHAGRNWERSDRAKTLSAALGGAGVVMEPASLPELSSAVGALYREGFEIVAVCGGDGSFFRALSAIVNVWEHGALPMFLPLRAGSMNTIVRGLGCPSISPERAVVEVVRRLRSTNALKIIDRALIRVNSEHAGFMTGAGTVVSFLQAYYESPRRGPLGAAHLIARLATSAFLGTELIPRVFRWAKARIVADGGDLGFGEYSVIYASNVADIGLGFKPAYRAGERHDRFHLIAGPIPAMTLVRNLPAIHRGSPIQSPLVSDSLANRVEVEFDQPEPYMVDGDILDPVKRLTLEAGPILKIIQGWT